MSMTKRRLIVPSFNKTNFQITYNEQYKNTHILGIDSHIHSEGEIYINVSGDISFFCDGRIYPMEKGDIFVARPGEYHHCIYHSNALHRHYWILFDYKCNRHIWDSFFPSPFENVLRPVSSKKEALLEICQKLMSDGLSEGDMFQQFFSLMTILKTSDGIGKSDVGYDREFAAVLDYINKNISKPMNIKSISDNCYISISTIERSFMKYIGMRPTEYIRRKKLIKASELLKSHTPVSTVAETVGYTDCSYFISIFKKTFGMTPLQYTKAFGYN